MHSSNAVVGHVMAFNNNITGYFDLGTQNELLAYENAKLRKLVNKRDLQLQSILIDTISSAMLDTLGGDRTNRYQYTVAKVVNNSISSLNNYMTIDKGTEDGIRPGMGVVSPTGIVGKVLLCSEHYSTINSLLNSKFTPAVSIKGSNATGILQWKGNDPKVINLAYIARHLKPKVGDTVLTSNTSDIFPPDLPVGRIKKVIINDNSTFYELQVDLSTDFSTIGYVYLIDNQLQKEKILLESKTKVDFDPENGTTPKP
jgi:rod shape-determining protein MreC